MASPEFERALLEGDVERARAVPNVNMTVEYPRILALGPLAFQTFIKAFDSEYYLAKMARALIDNYRPEYKPLAQQLWNLVSYSVQRILSEAKLGLGTIATHFSFAPGYYETDRSIFDMLQARDFNDLINIFYRLTPENLQAIRNAPPEIQARFLDLIKYIQEQERTPGHVRDVNLRKVIPQLVDMILQNYSSYDDEFLAGLLDEWKSLGLGGEDELVQKMLQKGVPPPLTWKLGLPVDIDSMSFEQLFQTLEYAIDVQDKTLLNELASRGLFQVPETKEVLSRALRKKVQKGPERNEQALNERIEWIRWLLQNGA